MNSAVKRIIAVMLTIVFVFCFVSCSKKKKVNIIINTQPDTKKSSGEDITEQTAAPTADAKYITATFDDESMTVFNTYENTVIPYAQIEEYEYMQAWSYDDDVMLDGSSSVSFICAKMSAQEDEYMLFCYKAVSNYISIVYKGKQVIFNLNSYDATKQCYDTIKEKVG